MEGKSEEAFNLSKERERERERENQKK